MHAILLAAEAQGNHREATSEGAAGQVRVTSKPVNAWPAASELATCLISCCLLAAPKILVVGGENTNSSSVLLGTYMESSSTVFAHRLGPWSSYVHSLANRARSIEASDAARSLAPAWMSLNTSCLAG